MKKNRTSLFQKRLAWPELFDGTLIKRYKRFLADVRLSDGSMVTAHCPNSGTMRACSEAGRPVYLSYHDNPKRKLKYTWEIIDMPGSLVGVNTLVPNKLVKQSVESGLIRELSGYETVRAEVKTSTHSRLDLLLKSRDKGECYVEIKNCTLVEDGVARFPDAVTTRGRKHLLELQRLVFEGKRGVIFFLVQRMDAGTFRPADDIDPSYGETLRRVLTNGVEALVYDVSIDLTSISIRRRIRFSI